MLIPNENETQPQFAIRFHEAMADSIADTSKRNKACFAAWDEHRGDDPTIKELVESRFTPDQYQRLHNVAMFHEHTVPAQKIQDKEIPAQHYGRDELAEMVDGMNDRILDHDEFSPITRGHTGQKPGAKDGERQMPEVLGFAGPYRLGMIGRKNPRWAIFGTEYHMKDAVPELRKRVGRSPEVWRYSRMRDRFFYPIATLGEEMPRLNLPPAHYSRRNADESPVFVECYSAVFPGGSNTFVPSFKASPDGRKPMADQYSADPSAAMSQPPAQTPIRSGEGTKLSDLTLEELMEVWLETQPMQFLFGLMRQSGDSGMPNPAVPNQIPPDPNAAAGGAMAGGAMAPGAPPSPADPAAQMPGQPAQPSMAQPPAPQPPMNQPPAAPAAGAPPVPPKPGMPPMVQDKDKDNYSRQLRDVMDANAQLRKQLDAAMQRIAEIDGEKTRIERYSRLEKLSSDFILRPEVELERTAGYSPEQFEAHVQIITDNYQRTLTNMPDYAALSDGVNATPGGGVTGPSKSESTVSNEELPIIEKYCIEHDMNFFDAKAIYVRNNKSFPAKPAKA